MVLVNREIGGVKYNINLKENTYKMFTGDSGIGKTYACSLIVDMLNTCGNPSFIINARGYSNIKKLCENNKYFLLIIDEVEQIENEIIDIDFIKQHSENVWFISRKPLPTVSNYCILEIDSLSIKIRDRRQS